MKKPHTCGEAGDQTELARPHTGHTRDTGDSEVTAAAATLQWWPLQNVNRERPQLSVVIIML